MPAREDVPLRSQLSVGGDIPKSRSVEASTPPIVTTCLGTTETADILGEDYHFLKHNTQH